MSRGEGDVEEKKRRRGEEEKRRRGEEETCDNNENGTPSTYNFLARSVASIDPMAKKGAKKNHATPAVSPIR